jgi:argininosuccinate synthase
MDFMRAAVEASQANVTGEVRVKLYKGNTVVTGRRSPSSLYEPDLVTFEDAGPESDYDQSDATGFIRLQGLRLRKP